jgi:hypothetical protein
VNEEEPSGIVDQSQSAAKQNQPPKFEFPDEEDDLWNMEFDGALGKEGDGIGIWIHAPKRKSLNLPQNVHLSSYKLAFDCSITRQNTRH